MKNSIKIALLISTILLIVVIVYRNKKEKQLGKLKVNRPPKVRIVYSKKLKPKERPQITSSESAEKVLREIWSSQMEVREEIIVLLLDRKNRVLGYYLLSQGGISGTVADIKLIYSVALESLASGIIIAHNHPSGSTEPSEADIHLTTKIKAAGNHLEISLLDHIILTKEDYYSFADNGRV
jgi:DNA repair protein RadC